VDLVEVAEKTRDYVRAAKASATLRAYQSDWADFSAWCRRQGLNELPADPATVALYLASLAEDHKPATLSRRLTSIARAHEAAGLASPATMRQAVVSETLKGIRRTHGTAQHGKTALLIADLVQLVAHVAPGLLGTRDRALALVGYAGGLRRSELAALQVRDLKFTDAGATATIRRSKRRPGRQGKEGGSAVRSPSRQLPGAGGEGLARAGQYKGRVLFRAVDRHGRIRPEGLTRIR